MKKIKMKEQAEIKVSGIVGFIERRVTPFGTGTKVVCPKEYLGKRVSLLILKD
jgi:putative transposon-encoded protein